MEGKKFGRIIKKVPRLLLVQIMEVLEEETSREKKVCVRPGEVNMVDLH
jgi:hypothetical protein